MDVGMQINADKSKLTPDASIDYKFSIDEVVAIADSLLNLQVNRYNK
jgi:hypothetical protein